MKNQRMQTWTAGCAVLLLCTMPARGADKPPVVQLEPLPTPILAQHAAAVTPDAWLNMALLLGTRPEPITKAEPEHPFDTRMQPAYAAAQIASTPDALLVAALLHGVHKDKIIPFVTPVVKQPVTPTKAERLDLTDYIIIDKEPLAKGGSELEAYAYVLDQARKMPLAALRAGSKKHITYPHMFKQSEEYRGEIVHINGILRRLRKYDKPHKLLKNQGIEAVYEGWVLEPKQYGPNPVCIVFTELPKGFEVGEVMYKEIEFDGYFFKIIEYESGEVRDGRKVGRYSPILIGHGPFNPHAGTEDPTVNGSGLLNLFLALLAGTLSLALGLVFWYRYSDRKIRDRITRKSDEFVEPQPGHDDPPPEPLYE